jgi:hypothetical protein
MKSEAAERVAAQAEMMRRVALFGVIEDGTPL